MRKRRHTFASPFVIVLGCGSKTEPVEEPAPIMRTATPTDVRPEDFIDFGPKPDAPPPPRPIGKVERDGRGCVKTTADDMIPVNCPDELLVDASPDELVVGQYGLCFRVYERKLGNRSSRTYFDEGQIRCPPSGPNVRLPQKTSMVLKSFDPPGTYQFSLDEESLTCRRQVPANPPYNVSARCPEELLPELVGLEPEREGSRCSYRGVVVKCPAPPKPKK